MRILMDRCFVMSFQAAIRLLFLLRQAKTIFTHSIPPLVQFTTMSDEPTVKVLLCVLSLRYHIVS